MTPLTFEPILKRIRWGGTRLGTVLGKPLGPHTDYAESWEVADHGADQSLVASGPLRGMSLGRLVQESGERLLGVQAGLSQFPLLVKFLDANDWLSLQVHPNDAQAAEYEPGENGKTEAWVILDAEPGSRICAGLKAGVDRSVFAAHLSEGTVEDTLHMFEVQAGDCIFVPAGTVHAIGPGILLAEIQQQSDLTFRLHDWGRLGSDGQPRALHIEESLACIDFSRGPVSPVVPAQLNSGSHASERLVREDYFGIDRHRASTPFAIVPEQRFRVLVCLDGSAEIAADNCTAQLRRGQTVLVPACVRQVDVVPERSVTLLEVHGPQ